MRRNEVVENTEAFPLKNKKGKGREAFPFFRVDMLIPATPCAGDELRPQAERLALALSAKAANASLSNTARSASTLRSISIAALCRPFIIRL